MLDGYAGFYRLGEDRILTVTRNGAQLSAQLTGQPSVPIYPESPTEFFYKVVDAQISFVTDAQGHATSLVLHQNGADMAMPRIDGATAQEIAGRWDKRLKSQTPTPGSEAALRRLVDGVMSGKPDYSEMSPAFADVTRKQLPRLQPGLAMLGPVKTVQFLGVSSQGTDVYSVRHEKGAMHWNIVLDSNGKIAGASVVPEP